jgi:hypothetical protein
MHPNKLYLARGFIFAGDYISCTHCAACYDRNDDPTFCQVFSQIVYPTKEPLNQYTAQRCPFWVPKGIDRSKVILPEHDRWYEKDSIA